MSSTSFNSTVDKAQIAIYAIILPPAIYCLFRHGKHGLLGWVYLQIFCTIRIVASGMGLSEKNGSTSIGALIVENIGLSPLILTAAGILHEARKARGSIGNSKLEWVNVLLFHIGVSGALALIAVGISIMVNKDASTSGSGSILVKAGFGIVFLCWVVLALWTLVSFRARSLLSISSYDDHYYKNSFASGNMLLYSVLFSIPLILLRGIYGAISLFSSQPSSFSSNEAANVCMSVVPQLLAAVIFVVAGLMTRNIKAELSASQRVVRIDEREGRAPRSPHVYV